MDDFTFYLQFTKPLVLNLPNIKDRVMAALWLEKLCEINESSPKDNLHVEYLKLLLFALQRTTLGGIFKKRPPKGSLEQYPKMNTAMDMIKLVKSEKEKSFPSFPSVHTAVGGGMREFAAIQEIPDFGLHGYYAMSNEPLPLWSYNKPGLFKSSEDTKNIRRFKVSREYEKLREFNSLQATPRKVDLTTTIINDMQRNNIKSVTDIKEDQIKKEEISRIEMRPYWGTSRYFERLIDQSPHITADLEAATADALLRVFKDKSSSLNKEAESCFSSVKKRQLEKSSIHSPDGYNSECRKMQFQRSNEGQSTNLKDVGISSTDCCKKKHTKSPKNKWKNDSGYKSSTFSKKGCFLNPDY